MQPASVYNEFYQDIKKAAECIGEVVNKEHSFLIVSHNDADALSACGILTGALFREGAKFVARSVHRIEDFLLEFDGSISEHDCFIFTDIGSGYIDELVSLLKEEQVLILDHHAPSSPTIPARWTHVNPHLRGINGVFEISASGISYLVAKSLNSENTSYAPIAVVGALGDQQDKGSKKELRGLNKTIVDEALSNNLISDSEDLVFYGRNFRPLHLALANTTSPYITGLTGREDNCVSFVLGMGLRLKDQDQWRVIADLSEDEKKLFFNSIVSYLASKNLPPSLASELIGHVYELVTEDPWSPLRDAREFASLLNACGKSGRQWLGIAIAMGSRGEILEEAQKMLEEYRSTLAKYMEYATQPGIIVQHNYISVLRGGQVIDEKQVSSVASLISSSGLLPNDKPLVAFADAGELTKISARATKQLVDRGLDLGAILKETANHFGGRGGGHSIAAGAEVPSSQITSFLSELDKKVGEILSVKGNIQA